MKEFLLTLIKNGKLSTRYKTKTNLSAEEIYLVVNDMKESPKCEFCNNKATFKKFTIGYKQYCSDKKCINASRVKNLKKKMIEKYGVDNPSKIKENREKASKRMKEKQKSKEFREKIKQTNLKRYGVQNVFQAKEIKEKIKQTNLEKYGVQNISQTEKRLKELSEFAKKHKLNETYKNKYGSNYSSHKNLEYKEKVKKTNKEKYNVEYYNQSQEYKENRINKLKEHYSYYNNIEHHLKYIDSEGNLDVDSFMKDTHFETKTGAKNYLRKLNIDFNLYKTSAEIEIQNFLESNKVENIICNSRSVIKPLELDIYVPEHKFAIEYNGLMFHSSGFYSNGKIKDTDKNYHLNKTELCEQQGIQLFHIFENEWLDETKQEIWKSVINEKLGLNEIIDTKDCYVKIVSDVDKDEFLNKNHIEGTIKSNINLGLYRNNDIISIISFIETNQDEYKMPILCTKINISDKNLFPILMNYFEEKYKPKTTSIELNRRWNTYRDEYVEDYGFKKINKNEPNEFYFKIGTYYLEDKINEKFINKYRKIYDSGNIVYTKIY